MVLDLNSSKNFSQLRKIFDLYLGLKTSILQIFFQDLQISFDLLSDNWEISEISIPENDFAKIYKNHIISFRDLGYQISRNEI